jgi:hypothetical protein
MALVNDISARNFSIREVGGPAQRLQAAVGCGGTPEPPLGPPAGGLQGPHTEQGVAATSALCVVRVRGRSAANAAPVTATRLRLAAASPAHVGTRASRVAGCRRGGGGGGVHQHPALAGAPQTPPAPKKDADVGLHSRAQHYVLRKCACSGSLCLTA